MQRKYANRSVYRRHDPQSMRELQEKGHVKEEADESSRKARLLGRIIGGGGGFALVRLLREKGLMDRIDLRDLLAIVTGSQAGSTVAERVEDGTRRPHRRTV